MFKNHPKGLLGAALSNMGERFGFYIMMAILVLFLSAKFGLSGTHATIIYSVFYFCIYAFAFIGGLIADKTRNYKGTIMIGLILMAIGYLMISIPTGTPVPAEKFVLYLLITCFGLFTIAFGNGLFKGNLQAVVGQMYDNENYRHMRDSGFQWFYMFINVGAVFSPLAAVGIRNWWVQKHGFVYNSDLPRLCHEYLTSGESMQGFESFQTLAEASGQGSLNIAEFTNQYLNVFSTGFHYAFAIAIGAMLISMAIYLSNRKGFPDPAKKEKAVGVQAGEMTLAEVRQRIYALFAVFAVVIFFWFSFHQNGVTLTFFARDYTDLSAINIDLGFTKIVGAEIFQSINPLFVILLTPLIIALFSWLRSKGIEPSTPKKIAIGMFIAAAAFAVMSLGSLGLPTFNEVKEMGALENAARVTPWLLIGTYFILTVAELFISPLGISFVSKVAPPKLQGMMQGLWLCATAIGNQLLFIGAIFYESIPIWATWAIFIAVCLMSMTLMLVMLKWLERVSK
ncbi:MAG: peptide MFS transporter [Lentimicrobiaceae bacterium]|nr:peptide MFS transporter [Lentimicrobiaceae bacterium]